jgi:hypothetical protein
MENRIIKYIPQVLVELLRLKESDLILDSPAPFPILTSSPNSDYELLQFSSSPQSIIFSRIALWNNPEVEKAVLQMIKLTNPTVLFMRA